MLHKPIHTTVYAKVLLFGEHLVFEGGNAIGMPTSQKAQSSFVVNSNKKFLLKSFIKTKTNNKRIHIQPAFLKHLQKTCARFKVVIPNKTFFGTLVVKTFFPIGSGFGSSAVFCSVIAKTIYQYSFPHKNQNSQSSLKMIWHMAHNLEGFFHSKTSGIDTGICVYNKPLFFLNTKTTQQKEFNISQLKPLTFKWNFPCKIVCGCIDRIQNCAHMILHVSKKISSHKTTKSTWFLHNQKATTVLINHYNKPVQQNDEEKIISQVANAINSIHTLFVQLGISTAQMDDIIKHAMLYGASAGKMSGGGGGGAFVLFCKNEKIATLVHSTIKQKFNPPALMIL